MTFPDVQLEKQLEVDLSRFYHVVVLQACQFVNDHLSENVHRQNGKVLLNHNR